MRKTLGAEYERWYKVQGKNYEVGGYYTWIDKREKYQFSVPIEGTNLNAVATAYLDEFTLPMTDLQARANTMLDQTTRTMTIVLAATAILIALVVAVYSYRLSGRLKSLSGAADRISVGNLDVEIEGTKSRDEIGVLANDLSRMQTSIRLAIKRLRERR
jgi:methyl-accepting chemotaxis protein